MSFIKNFRVAAADSPSVDAFGRWRVSEPATLFDSKQLADKQPLFFDDQQTSGAGTSSTYNANQASTTISVGNLTAGTRVRQTFRRFNYQSGKSQLILASMVFGSAAAGITRRVGYYDDGNGLFFEQTQGNLSVVRRTGTSGAPVDNTVNQSNWNIDPMDGSGASGITLDLTKTQIAIIDFEWLGVGRVRMGWVVDGMIYYCHEFLNANSLSLVYMSAPNLPIRYEIDNDGTGGAADFVHICSSVASEGGRDNTGFPFGISRGNTPLTTLNDADIYPLISVRLNNSYQTSNIQFLDFTIICTSTAAFNYYFILNPTVAGAALAWTQVTNSSLDADIVTTNATKVSGGTVLLCRTGQSGNNTGVEAGFLNSDFSLGSTIAGVSDIVTLGVQRVTGTTETFYGSLNWRDQQ